LTLSISGVTGTGVPIPSPSLYNTCVATGGYSKQKKERRERKEEGREERERRQVI